MNYLTFVSTIVFSAALIEGIYVLRANPESAVNRLYFLMAFSLAVWLFGAALAYSARTREEVILFFRICSFGFIFLHAFTLHFSLVLSFPGAFPGARGVAPYLVYLLYLPSFLFYYKSMTGLIVFQDFVRSGDFWTAIPDFGSVTLPLLMVNYISYYLVAAGLILGWRKRTTKNREKKQALIIMVSILSTIVLFNFEPFILPLITKWQPIVISPIFGVLWISGVGYAILRFRFMTWAPEAVSKDILNSIDEPVFVLDSHYVPVYMNHKAKTIAAKAKEFRKDENRQGAVLKPPGIVLKELIETTPTLSQDLEKLSRGEIRDFSCRLSVSGSREEVLDMKFSLIRDSFGDVLGIVLVGREVKDKVTFRALFSLTEKEMEVLQHLMGGKKTGEIAALQGVSPRTIKYHAAGIYTKLQVRNKIELFRMLGSYHLFPEQQAEQISFPLLQKTDKK